MKKILAIILLFTVLLFAGEASWTVHLYNAQFGNGTSTTLTHTYGGQSIIALVASGGIRGKTEELLADVTYTGVDSVYAGKLYHQIEPIPFWPDNLVWLSIDKDLILEIDE